MGAGERRGIFAAPFALRQNKTLIPVHVGNRQTTRNNQAKENIR